MAAQIASTILKAVPRIAEVWVMRQYGSRLRMRAPLAGALSVMLVLLVAFHGSVNYLQFASAQRPSRIAFTSNRDGNLEIYTMNADGTGVTRVTNHPGADRRPSLSSDGTRIAFESNRDGNFEIYVASVDGTSINRLTNSPATDVDSAFSPDGTKVAFASNRDGNGEIYVMGADGTNVTRLSNNRAIDEAPSFSHDGARITFQSDRDGNFEVYTMGLDGTGVTRVTNHPAADLDPRYSPDGRKIAFMSLRHLPPFTLGGPFPYFQVFWMNADGTGVSRLTNSTVSEGVPVFSPDGQKVMFTSERDRNSSEIFVMSVDGTGRTRLTNFAAETVGGDWR